MYDKIFIAGPGKTKTYICIRREKLSAGMLGNEGVVYKQIPSFIYEHICQILYVPLFKIATGIGSSILMQKTKHQHPAYNGQFFIL